MAIFGMIGLLVMAGLFWVSGSATVIDRGADVASTAIVGGAGPPRELYRLPGGLFYASPTFDGSLTITCRNGRRHNGGYVTAGMHTWVRIESATDCARVTELS